PARTESGTRSSLPAHQCASARDVLSRVGGRGTNLTRTLWRDSASAQLAGIQASAGIPRWLSFVGSGDCRRAAGTQELCQATNDMVSAGARCALDRGSWVRSRCAGGGAGTFERAGPALRQIIRANLQVA